MKSFIKPELNVVDIESELIATSGCNSEGCEFLVCGSQCQTASVCYTKEPESID